MKKLSILALLLGLLFTKPAFSENLVFHNEDPWVWFSNDRAPTTTESGVNSNIDSSWRFDWLNTTTNDKYAFKGGSNGSYIWDLYITDKNITNYTGNLNTLRNYSSVSLAFSTSRTPSSSRDVQVIANISQTSTLLVTATTNVQINTTGSFVTLCAPSLSGVAATQVNTCTFIVPKGASYQIVSASGTNSISSIYELSF